MFSSKVKSGISDIIASGSVFNFLDRRTDISNPKKETLSVSPIDIEVFWQESLLFNLTFYFKFVDDDNPDIGPGYEIKTISDKHVQFTLRNFYKAENYTIYSMFPCELATSHEGDKFIIYFSAVSSSQVTFSYLLNYTIYHIKGNK